MQCSNMRCTSVCTFITCLLLVTIKKYKVDFMCLILWHGVRYAKWLAIRPQFTGVNFHDTENDNKSIKVK